ncbi:MAG TPA: hypothetical protein VFS00_07075, partial [Polyangiaceae bacterium]|nr:hypothetical protein [Polyangiaceae bacterium]
EKLPPAGGAAAEPRRAGLTPPPVFDDSKPGRPNTAFLAPEQLVDPDAKPGYDLILSSDFTHALAWTGPNNPMSESVLYERAGDFSGTLERALAYRYIVVYRPAGGGSEAFVFDLTSTDLAASAKVEAAGDFTRGRKQLAQALERATGGTFVVR